MDAPRRSARLRFRLAPTPGCRHRPRWVRWCGRSVRPVGALAMCGAWHPGLRCAPPRAVDVGPVEAAGTIPTMPKAWTWTARGATPGQRRPHRDPAPTGRTEASSGKRIVPPSTFRASRWGAGDVRCVAPGVAPALHPGVTAPPPRSRPNGADGGVVLKTDRPTANIPCAPLGRWRCATRGTRGYGCAPPRAIDVGPDGAAGADAPCAPLGRWRCATRGTRGCAALHPGLSTPVPLGPQARSQPCRRHGRR